MERSIKGDILVVPFPFSDLSQSKKRPALVIANIKEGNDLQVLTGTPATASAASAATAATAGEAAATSRG